MTDSQSNREFPPLTGSPPLANRSGTERSRDLSNPAEENAKGASYDLISYLLLTRDPAV